MAATLEMILASRDARQELQRTLIQARPDCALVVLTVVIPGPEKRIDDSLVVARAGVEALKKCFAGRTVSLLEKDLETGYEAFLQVDCDPEEAKRLSMEIEETHFLGRLFDIDVIGADMVPLQRTDRGRRERKCLMCDNNARVCMRLGTHSVADLAARIHQLANEYLRRL